MDLCSSRVKSQHPKIVNGTISLRGGCQKEFFQLALLHGGHFRDRSDERLEIFQEALYVVVSHGWERKEMEFYDEENV